MSRVGMYPYGRQRRAAPAPLIDADGNLAPDDQVDALRYGARRYVPGPAERAELERTALAGLLRSAERAARARRLRRLVLYAAAALAGAAAALGLILALAERFR